MTKEWVLVLCLTYFVEISNKYQDYMKAYESYEEDRIKESWKDPIKPCLRRLRPTLDGVQGPNSEDSIWTHLNQIESLSGSLPWTLACILVLRIMSFPFELFFLVRTNWISLQNTAM